MGKLISCMFGAAVSLSLLAVTAQVSAGPLDDPGRNRRARAALLSDETTTAAAFHNVVFGGDGVHAGTISSARSYIQGVPGLGRVTIDISASWDYGAYSAEHPCAIMNVGPHSFAAGNFPHGPFTTDATVTFTRRKNGDQLSAKIRGGSVCEIDVQPGPPACTANESVIAFEITGGTGRLEGWSGSGAMRTVVNTCAGLGPEAIVVDDVYLRIDRGGRDSASPPIG